MSFAFSRRGLLRGAGGTLFAASVAQWASACAHSLAGAGGTSPSGTNNLGEPSSSKLSHASLAPELEALPDDKRVGFALVGIGELTRAELLPAFKHCKLAKLRALVSGDRAKAERTAQQYGLESKHLYSYDDFDRIADDKSIDVVYVVLPNSMHAEYSVRAAQAGKHVLCEKPMAPTVEECSQMILSSAQANKLLMVAYRLQYEPHHREAIRLMRSGELGKLKNIVASNGQMEKDPNVWRLKRALSGGGPLPDVGIYCLNAARYLTGEEPLEVSALKYSTPGDPRFTEVEEQIDFTLRFPSGTLASCATSYNTYDSKEFRLLCERGSLAMDPAFSYRGLRMRVMRGGEGDAKKEQVDELELGDKNQFALEMDHMARCVLEKRKPFTPGEEGRQDVRLISAIYESAREGRVVKLAPMDGLDKFRNGTV